MKIVGGVRLAEQISALKNLRALLSSCLSDGMKMTYNLQFVGDKDFRAELCESIDDIECTKYEKRALHRAPRRKSETEDTYEETGVRFDIEFTVIGDNMSVMVKIGIEIFDHKSTNVYDISQGNTVTTIEVRNDAMQLLYQMVFDDRWLDDSPKNAYDVSLDRTKLASAGELQKFIDLCTGTILENRDKLGL